MMMMMMMMMIIIIIIIIICFISRTFLTLARQLLKYKDTVLSDNYHCKEGSGWGEEFLGEVKDYKKLLCIIIATANLTLR